jgi:hypothetical protein
MDAGSSSNLTVYVRNECNSPVSLGLYTSNWDLTSSASYISLKWNYTGYVLRNAEVIPLELTLTLSPAIIDITDFSFETILSGIGQ